VYHNYMNLWVFLVLIGQMFGCNGLFYQPLASQVLTPTKFELDYREGSVPSGNETLAYWVISSSKERATRGTVVHFHGNAENMTTHFLYVAWLAEFGYRVVTFDYRGYGKSSGTPTRAGVVADGVAMLQFAVATWPDEPLVVIAQSIGGAIAVPAIVAAKVRPHLLVLDSTFASYRHIARQKLDSIWLTWALQYPLSYLVSDELSPIDSAAEIRCPVISIHGTDDRIVPIEHGRALFAKVGSQSKEWWEIPQGEHTSAFAIENPEYRNRLLMRLR
jgi:uncharacterized protein